MSVYVVIGYDYGGNEVLGAYSTKERADVRAASQSPRFGGATDVLEMELDRDFDEEGQHD